MRQELNDSMLMAAPKLPKKTQIDRKSYKDLELRCFRNAGYFSYSSNNDTEIPPLLFTLS